MEIKIAKSAGFCYGVKQAVFITEKQAESDKKTFTLGNIIHNQKVVDKIAKKGILPIQEVENIPENSKVIIRAHGIPKRYYDILNNKNVEIVDATCVFVKKIHKLVNEYYKNGYKIIIIGQKDHPEVIGINGWCNDEAIIIDNIPENIVFDNNLKYFCVVQTTFSVEKYNNILKYLINILNIFEFNNTICYTTKERQKEAELLSKEVDTMIVIGDKLSSNTRKLFEVVSANCNNSYLISDLDDLKKIKNKYSIKKLGITAGASTPNELIEEVNKVMADSQSMFVAAMAKLSDKTITDKNKGKLYKQEIKAKVNLIKEDGDYLLTVFEPGKYACEFIMPFSESKLDSSELDFKVGDEIEVIIIKKPEYNEVVASRKAYLQKNERNDLFKKIFAGEPFDLKIKEVIKNAAGLQGEFNGCTVFIPNSHVEDKPLTASRLEKYKGKTIKVVYLPDLDENNQPKKPNKKNMKASHKVILDAEKQEAIKKFWDKYEIGDVVTGKVVKIVSFGAFVEVDGKDCLVPLSLLAWYKVNSVKDILKQDKTYDFIIDESSNKESGKIILNYKELQLKPEDIIAVKYSQGTVVKGKVATITDKAMFVNLESGIDGRVFISEISNKFVKDINELYKVGDEVEAVVIDNEDNKVKLSIKLLLLEKENQENKENKDSQENKEKKQTKKKESKKEDVLNFIDEHEESATLGVLDELKDLLK